MKILVVKRDKIGDLLLTTPMLAHLAASRPDAEIHLLASDYNAWVVAGNPDLDRLWVYRAARGGVAARLRATLERLVQDARLRRERYDWAIVANGAESPRAIARGLAAKARRTVAYCAEPARYPRLSDALPVDPERHEMDSLLAMLAPLGVEPPRETRYPRYELPRASSEFAAAWLGERGLKPRRYLVLGLGARRAKKQPSAEQVLRWSGRFKRAMDLDTVFMWTPGKADDPLYPGDDALAQAVLDARAPQIHPFRGPIAQALGLVWSARASVFPDSGLMHFAAASPGGVLGLFAETDVSPGPAQFAPRGRNVGYLEAAKSVAELPDELVYERLGRLVSP